MKKYRGFIIATIIVAFVVGALAFGDMAARRVGEQEMARQAQQALDLESEPEISLGGWPFLLHAATRSFPSAKGTIDSLTVPYEGEQVTVTDVEVNATDIAPEGDGYLVAHAEGQGHISYSELSEAAGITLASGGDGKLDVSVEWNGISGTVTGDPTLDKDEQTITLENAEIELVGLTVPSSVSQQILDLAVEPIDVSHEYFNVDSVSADDDGVRFTMLAEDLRLSA